MSAPSPLPHLAGKKLRAGVLGIVGQRLVHLLAGHPWFELTEVAASERFSGKTYAEAARWHLDASSRACTPAAIAISFSPRSILPSPAQLQKTSPAPAIPSEQFPRLP
jgi:semialdehyde dehydrogenase family protein